MANKKNGSPMRILLFTLLSFSINAHSVPIISTIGWGTGYSWTQATFNEKADEFGGAIETPSYTSVTNQDLPWSLYAGLKFTPYYGIEFGYLDYGSIEFTQTLTKIDSQNVEIESKTAKRNVSTQGFLISHVLFYPLSNHITLQGKAGLLFGDNQYSEQEQITYQFTDDNGVTSTIIEPVQFSSQSKAFSKAQFAIALLYQYSDNWFMRLQTNQIEYELTQDHEKFTQWFSSLSFEHQF